MLDRSSGAPAASVAGFASFVVLLVLAQLAQAQGWDPPNMDAQTLPPLLRILSTVGLLLGTWFLLSDRLGRPQAP